jgi:hypothetical protein
MGNPTDAEIEAARAMIAAVYKDQEAEINGRKYQFCKMVHKQRRKVFAFFTKHMGAVENKDLSFLDSDEFEPVEEIMHNAIALDGSLLSKLGDEHWDRYPGDYVTLTTIAMQVIAYPFMVAAPTD